MLLGDIYNKTPSIVEKGRIYKIVNNVNGLVYIGCTINSLNKRFTEHLYRCFKTDYKSKLYNSIKKYGAENFSIELIEECELNVIYETEKKYIEKYDSFNNGLNATFGGEGCLGYTHSPEIRQKISENTKNGNSHKGKTYDVLYGDKASEEREKRRLTVKNSWGLISEEDKLNRINKAKETIQRKSKYGVDLVREIKQKINEGLTIKEFKKSYPNVRPGFYYELKNGISWSNIN